MISMDNDITMFVGDDNEEVEELSEVVSDSE